MATTVRALTDGFYKTRRRQGDVFTLDDKHKLGKWMEEVSPQDAAKVAAETPNRVQAPGQKVGVKIAQTHGKPGVKGAGQPGVKAGAKKDLA